MTAFVLPENLVASASIDRFPDRRRWIADLPSTVPEVAARWGLRLGPPYQPGGQCSWVGPVVDPDGRELVLKVGWRHPEAEHEADVLALWAGNGAVLAYAAETSHDTSVLLLERCVPGTPLNQAATESEQDVIVAGLLRRLWREPPAQHPFRSLQSMCEQWVAEFDEKLVTLPNDLDPGLARAGRQLFLGLPRSALRSAVLATDLHAENVLAARREPWLVIDPKPYVGDPTYDALQHMLNCEDRLTADPVTLCRRMAELLDLDTDRLLQWLFARCVIESIEWQVLGGVARQLAP